jgi:hypothetical protein
MKFKRYILLCGLLSVLFFTTSTYAQQILTPIGTAIKDKVIAGSTDSSAVFLGNGFFPVTYEKSGYNAPVKDTTKGWIRRKLFNEHFIQIEHEDYFLAIDPLLNISLGNDVLQNIDERLFQNTRGVQAFGEILNKVSFYTAFYENQARFAGFRSDYFKNRGEQRLKDGVYNITNATIPGGGRTKPFKEAGFDYASSAAYIRYQPFKQLALKFGNTPQFLGWGHRSFLLSDNSFNFSNLKIDWEITPKISYTIMRGKQLNLFRRAVTNQVESPYERKNYGLHYLAFTPNENISIGLFESTVYLRDEAVNSRSVDPMFYQPIIGVNTIALGSETSTLKNIIGLNFGWKILKKQLLYGQFVTDNFETFEYGAQLGWRSIDLFNIKNLFVQAEFNIATNRLFSAENRRLSYTHFNLPLAHTLGNGFEEYLIRAGYEWKKIYLNVKSVNYRADQSMADKSLLFESNNETVSYNESIISFNSVELGYILNHATRLSIFTKAIYRMSNTTQSDQINNGIIQFGLKTGLTNQYMDF